MRIAFLVNLVLTFVFASTSEAAVVSFRNNVNGYTGTVDGQTTGGHPDTDSAVADLLFSDYPTQGSSNPGDQGQQTLIRFDGIFGNGVGQIPLGSTINSATLTLLTTILSLNGPGDGGQFHRMLKHWNDTDTWNIWVDGIHANDIEAKALFFAQAGNSSLSPNVPAGTTNITVTTDVQAWSNGETNFGWAILPWVGGTDGWGFESSDVTNVAERPLLTVTFTVVPEPGSAVVLLCAGVLLARRRGSARAK